MARTRRIVPAGMVFHVLNRANDRARIFLTDSDYHAFLGILDQAIARSEMRLLAYSIMPSHWHLVEWPSRDGQMSRCMAWLTNTHARRYRTAHQSVGAGHLYQGRFKSFPIQDDHHLLTVIRYVERNALTAGLVTRAEDWRWSSLWARLHGRDGNLCAWPVGRPEDWGDVVNRPMTEAEHASIRRSMVKGCPYGSNHWTTDVVRRLALTPTTRGPGRPKKKAPTGAENDS